LAAHPQIFPFKIQGHPQDGESFTPLGSEAMRRTFAHVPPDANQLVGDATVSRLINDRSWADNCPHAKILLLLRDPVARCYSQMLMRHRLGTLHNNNNNVSAVIERQLGVFTAKVNAHPHVVSDVWEDEQPLFLSSQNCLFEGAYVVHLRRLLRGGVPPAHVRIYFTDDFLQHPADILRDAMAFVGVTPLSRERLEEVTQAKWNAQPPQQHGNDDEVNHTTSTTDLDLPDSLRHAMEEAMRPFDRALADFLGVIPPWRMTTSSNSTRSIHPTPESTSRRRRRRRQLQSVTSWQEQFARTDVLLV
jgi:hypothetical protein